MANSFPIHNLPLELFTSIIHQCMQFFQGYRELRYLVGLTKISEAWKDAINSTPFLWSSISSEDSRTEIETALINSQNHPLDIVYNPRWAGEWKTGEFATLMLPHAARWRTFDCRSRSLDRFELLRGVAVPALEFLGLEIFDPVLGQVELFNGIPERLRKLHIRGIPLPWPYEELRGLRGLSLTSMETHALSPSKLLQVFSNNRELTSVTIIEVPDETNQVPIAAPILMPKLQELTLEEISHQSLQQILPNLVMPRCHFIRISFPYFGTLKTTIASTFQNMIRHIPTAANGTLELDIRGYPEFVCEIDLNPGGGGGYAMRWEVPGEILEVEFLIPPNLKTIQGTFTQDGAWTILRSFQHLDTVTTIQIEDHTGDLQQRGFARYIGIPDCDEDGVWRWPFPCLEELWIQEYDDEDDLLMALRHRCGESMKNAWREFELPKPLKSVYMKDMDEGVCQEIEELLGPDCRVFRSDA